MWGTYADAAIAALRAAPEGEALPAHPTPWTVQVANEYGDPMIVDAEGCEVLECSEVGCTIFDIIVAAVNAYTRPPSGDVAAPEGEATATTTLPELMKQVFDERTPSGDDRCARCGGEGFTVTEYLRQDEHGRECPEYDRQMCAACEGTGERPPSGDDVEGPWVTREQIGELHDAFTTCLHTNRRCACTFWSDMDPEQQDEFVEMTRKVGIEVRDDVEGR